MSINTSKVKVLFVCLGNICRSPSAEAVMNRLVSELDLSNHILCDSAGTISTHSGEKADARMRTHAKKRGYDLTSLSRQIRASDFEYFDYIVTMDADNIKYMRPFMPKGNYDRKIKLMTDFCANPNPGFVPDPYYGGAEGFEQVLDILEDGCQGLIRVIEREVR